MPKNSKLYLITIIAIAFAAFYLFDIGQYLSLDYIKEKQADFQIFYDNNPALTISLFFLVYVLTTALSIPGATILTLMAGASFGFVTGTIIASFASSLGATIALLFSRYLLRDSIESKYGHKLAAINKGLQRDGKFYLLTLRLLPIIPFFLVNAVMGILSIKARVFYIISQIGMLPGTMIYIYAGTELAKIESLKDIASPGMIASLTLLAIFPLIARKAVEIIKTRKIMKPYNMPDNFDYNIVVIGAGSAGLVSSYIAAAVKAKVALIEKHKMGGDCLNTGCVPSKALISSAKMVNHAAHASNLGLKDTKIDFDFAKVMERIQNVITKIEPHDSVERFTSLGVDCISGTATIKDPYRVEVDGKTITTRNIIIATGASPLVPPIPGLDKIDYLTSDNIWNLRELPENMVVLGGGPIGAEMAQGFARFGSRVTLVEMAPQILIREDQEVIEHLEAKLKSEGVTVLTGYKAKSFHTANGENTLTCETEDGDKEIQFDKIVVALGRKANIKGFGLEELGVQIGNRGTIEADPFLRTNFPNIYVCGDVTGPYQFTHTAAHQAWYASVNALFGIVKKFRVDYRVIPWATFTDPEIARVGLNEKDAKAQKIPYKITTYGIDDLDRAIAEGEDSGFVKVLTSPGKDRILGVTIVGHHAGDIIAEFILAMKYNLGMNKLLGTIHIYPTFTESNKFVAGNWKKNHAPQKILQWAEKFHTWRRNK